MRPWMKVSLLIVLVMGLCWGASIWYWRATNRMPAAGDMITYMLAVPIGILAAIWIGRVVLDKMAAAPAAPAASSKVAPAAPPAPVAPALAMVAVSIRNAHGAAADELSGKLIEGKARGELDPELVDQQGFPVMTVRSTDADDTAVQEEVTEWLASKGVNNLELNTEQWRALTLATAVTAELAGEAAMSLMMAKPSPPMLYLQPIFPSDWHVDLRGAMGSWLKHVVLETGWPEKHLALAAAVPAEARGTSPVAVLGRVAHQANTTGLPLAALIVSSASHIAENCVERWSAEGTIFAASRPQGSIPGEGAAGMLVADMAQAESIAGLVYSAVHQHPEARRHNSADETKKADAKTISTMAARLLADTDTKVDEVKMLVADTDHRTSRVMETMEMASGTLPHLDLTAEVLSVGVACGASGAVPFVTALALAHHHALELSAPVFCISNDDPYRRSAVLIKPVAALS